MERWRKKLLRVKLKPGDNLRRGCLSPLKVGSVAERVRGDSGAPRVLLRAGSAA